jgi:hypothetical protein
VQSECRGSEATLGFKPESFTVAVISSYRGVVNWMKMMIHEHLDKCRVLKRTWSSESTLIHALLPLLAQQKTTSWLTRAGVTATAS